MLFANVFECAELIFFWKNIAISVYITWSVHEETFCVCGRIGFLAQFASAFSPSGSNKEQRKKTLRKRSLSILTLFLLTIMVVRLFPAGLSGLDVDVIIDETHQWWRLESWYIFHEMDIDGDWWGSVLHSFAKWSIDVTTTRRHWIKSALLAFNEHLMKLEKFLLCEMYFALSYFSEKTSSLCYIVPLRNTH